jgi:hypothetical protein
MLRFFFTRSVPVAVATTLAMLVVGCSRPPAVEMENLPLVASLRTACSARNEQWLAGVERAVAQRHGGGQMSAVEKNHFEKLIALARRGDWLDAEKQCYLFERAQLNRTRLRHAEVPQAPAHPHELSHVSVAGR